MIAYLLAAEADPLTVGPYEVVGFVILGLLFVVPPIIGYRLGLRRGRPGMWLLVCLFLSWLGVLIMVLLPKPAPPAAV